MRPPAPWSRVWHAALALVVLAALVGQVVLVVADDGSDAGTGAAVPLATRLVRLFSYFTVQSNLLVLAGALSLALDPLRDGRSWRVLRLDGVLGIVVTGLVFGTVLASLVQRSGADWWVNAGLHYVSPVMTLLGWLVLGPRPRVEGRTLAWAFAWPVGWIVLTFVRGALTGWYPYPFLDVGAVGYPVALRNTGFVVVLAVLLLAALRVLDRRLPARERAVPEDADAR